MGTAKVIKPEQLLDKDPAKLSPVMQSLPFSLPLFILIFMCYMLGGILMFVQLVVPTSTAWVTNN